MVFGDADFETNIRGCAPVAGAKRVMEAAARFFHVQTGSKYGTSTACAKCKRGYLHSVRMRVKGQERAVVLEHDPAKPVRSVRWGLLRGSNAKRTLSRIKRYITWSKGGAAGPAGQRVPQEPAVWKQKRERKVVNWVWDGHEGESVQEKRKKSRPCKEEEARSRYVRLKFCPECKEMHNRDMHGANGVFMHYECHCKRTQVPLVFRLEERKRRVAEQRAQRRQWAG